MILITSMFLNVKPVNSSTSAICLHGLSQCCVVFLTLHHICRWVGLESSWARPRPNAGMDGAGTSGSIASVGLTGIELMMRQLASVREGYVHGSLDSAAAWNLWPTHHASASSSVPPPSSSSLRFNRNTAGLRFRSTSPPVHENTPEIRDMVDRVREVLPHIPDEVIIEV